MKKLPRSIKKHIRKEKARIRRDVLDVKKQKESIEEIHQKFFKKPSEELKESKPDQKVKSLKKELKGVKSQGGTKSKIEKD